MMIRRIVSGGQTGADRAALDVAIDLGIPCGGWVPKGRLAEDGVIPSHYPDLREADDEQPETRTGLNIRDSDATLILSHGELDGGSKFTASKARELAKPWLHVDLARTSVPDAVREIAEWIARVRPAELNVAGPRASHDPAIYAKTKRILEPLVMHERWLDTGTERNGSLLTIALARRDAALASFRHWDQVRWLVPYWFCVLATASGGLVGTLGRPEDASLIRLASLGFGFFGLLCLLLVWNLGRYHKDALEDYRSFVARLPVDDVIKDGLRIDLPFVFTLTNFAIVRTATFWFFFYIVVLSLLFFFTALVGVWWKT